MRAKWEPASDMALYVCFAHVCSTNWPGTERLSLGVDTKGRNSGLAVDPDLHASLRLNLN